MTNAAKYIDTICKELNLRPSQVSATAKLISEGATVPFIARYRKEVTGMLDEVAVTHIRDRMQQLVELDQRRDSILKSLEERELLTDSLKSAILKADSLTTLEDLYLPYRPKRRTRAMIAREAGLEPLAQKIFEQIDFDVLSGAKDYINPEKEIVDEDKALAGARDIIAEWINEEAAAREEIRELYKSKALVRCRVLGGKEDEGQKYRDYFDWNEPLSKVPSHRLLAMRRGEAEGILILRIHPEEEDAQYKLERRFVRGVNSASKQVKQAAEDAYKRLLGPSIETEMRMDSKKQADEQAMQVFADNLRELLLASPLGEKTMLAVDPGYRTGCKTVALSAQGKLLHHDVLYLTASEGEKMEAARKVARWLKEFKLEAVAIGNGTASRETEQFFKQLPLPKGFPIVMVNESGASVYSASEAAREEFPNHDLTVRGAVSIGRRLMDPLAELVKIDPKSIGVGQYQHDVDQNALKRSLDDVVLSCVNKVGVEVNTASKQLLSYVSGLGPQLADNIVCHRNENGPFKSRSELKKVARLGPKAYEQSAGFLRIRDASNPLDRSAVHPERYGLVKSMATDVNCAVEDLMKNPVLRQKIKLEAYQTDEVGLPTLTDIMEELTKPGRDPRSQFEAVEFQEGIEKPEDLSPSMKLPGIVTNVTAFGAFVDIGVHQDGLVHISHLADQFVKDPADFVKVAQKVNVTVLEVDLARKRIALSMKSNPEIGSASRPQRSRERSGVRHETSRPKRGESKPPTNDWFSQALSKAESHKKR
ncbi:RNA-binding transcriptional accessory protein [Verrucomicrobia bacterium]|nr:RNA-binding transcriptional accessory protein [Verrucomicrobiota bacterium]